MNLIAKIKFHNNDIRMRLKDATLAKLENVHEIKRIKKYAETQVNNPEEKTDIGTKFTFLHTKGESL